METDHLRKALDELLETLASVEHDRWSYWQCYMHSKCLPQGDDGALLIPADLVKRWEKQIATRYSDLTDDEKESDREQVRKYLPLIVSALILIRFHNETISTIIHDRIPHRSLSWLDRAASTQI
jgi:hypothetical protein